MTYRAAENAVEVNFGHGQERYELTPAACSKPHVSGSESSAPSGSYCNQKSGVKITIDDTSHLDLHWPNFVDCKKEEYALDAASGTVTFSRARDTGDCLGRHLWVDPSMLAMAYRAAENALEVNFGPGQERYELTPA